jgi:hypothetical protein
LVSWHTTTRLQEHEPALWSIFLNRQPKKVAQQAVVSKVYYNMRITVAIQDSRCPKQADIVNIEVHEPAAYF